VAERVLRLSQGLGAGGAYRGEALRRIVLRLARALEVVAQARGQSDLVDRSGSGSDVLGEIGAALEDLVRLIRGATRRLIGEDPADVAVVTEVPDLVSLIERSVSAGVPPNPTQLSLAITAQVADIPRPLARPWTVRSFAFPLPPRRAQPKASTTFGGGGSAQPAQPASTGRCGATPHLERFAQPRPILLRAIHG
jgi:hypothetical protein